MTTTLQIERYLKNVPNFLGVFPSDELVKNPPANSCLIVNLSPHNKEGTHWIALLHLNSQQQPPYMFDSYGFDETYLDYYSRQHTHLKAYLTLYSSIWNRFDRNYEDYQSMDADTCGEWSSYAILNGSPSDNPNAYKIFKPYSRINGNEGLHNSEQLKNNDRIILRLINIRK